MDYVKIVTTNGLQIIASAGLIEENKKYPDFLTIHNPVQITGNLGFLGYTERTDEGELRQFTMFLNQAHILLMIPIHIIDKE